mmetsp:Transcript_1412/g.2577  ORF Transcript_1412/g.2577 Transcript_1412/m.2577 type:complete len:540 (+) Transcript_1412:3074-4693(+)
MLNFASNGKKGSSGFVARTLATAVSSFLEVNESMIESRLLNPKYSSIAFNDVRLKPRVVLEDRDRSVEITGTIESVVFTWKWNYFKGSKMYKGIMKKTSLVIRGANIVILEKESTNLKPQINEVAKDEKLDAERKRPKFLRNVIEQFSLNIEDITVHIKLPSNDEYPSQMNTSIIFVGKSIELNPLGLLHTEKLKKRSGLVKKKVRNPLLQDLTIGSISARILQVDEEEKEIMLPLIDPFQYTAKIKRFDGDRFSGVMTGLEVIGQEMQNDITCHSEETQSPLHSLFSKIEIYTGVDNDEIETALHQSVQNFCLNLTEATRHVFSEGETCMHCGEIQTVAIFRAIKMFSSNDNQGNERVSEKRQHFLTSVVKPGGLGEISAISPTNFVHSSRELNKSSIFHLPFPCIQVFLPNDSSITVYKGVLTMRTDGTRNMFEADGGVTVNDQTLLQSGSPINVDFIRKEITLKPYVNPESNHEGVVVANFEANLRDIQLLSSGLGSLIRLKRLVHGRPSTPKNHDINTQNPRWSIRVMGSTEIKL